MNLQSPFALLKKSVTFYIAHFKSLAVLVLTPAILLAIVSYLVELYTSTDGVLQLDTMPLYVIVISSVVLLASIITSILGNIGIILFADDPSLYPTPTSMYKSAQKYFFPYLWIAVLSTLAILGGFILLIIPGVIFMIWFTFAPFILLFEERRGMEALRASRALVRGRWWSVFIRQFFLGFACGVFMQVSGLLIGFILPDKNIAAAVNDLISSIVFSIIVVYLYFLYRDVKAAGPAPIAPTAPSAPMP